MNRSPRSRSPLRLPSRPTLSSFMDGQLPTLSPRRKDNALFGCRHGLTSLSPALRRKLCVLSPSRQYRSSGFSKLNNFDEEIMDSATNLFVTLDHTIGTTDETHQFSDESDMQSPKRFYNSVPKEGTLDQFFGRGTRTSRDRGGRQRSSSTKRTTKATQQAPCLPKLPFMDNIASTTRNKTVVPVPGDQEVTTDVFVQLRFKNDKAKVQKCVGVTKSKIPNSTQRIVVAKHAKVVRNSLPKAPLR